MSEYFQCAVCQDLLVDPVTLLCQHTFCRHCILQVTTCPICRTPLFVSPAKNNLITDLIIREVGLDTYQTRIDALNTVTQKTEAEQNETRIREQVWREIASTVQSQTPQVIELCITRSPWYVRTVRNFAERTSRDPIIALLIIYSITNYIKNF